MQIANAPKNVDRRTVNLRDLTSEIKHLLPEQGKGVDLSLLTATLCPQEVCVEPDVEWRFDSLFEQTCQDIHAEEEVAEEAARSKQKKAGGGGGGAGIGGGGGGSRSSRGGGGAPGPSSRARGEERSGSRRRVRGSGAGKMSEKSDLSH